MAKSQQRVSKATIGEDIQLGKDDDGIHVQPRGQFHKLPQSKGFDPIVVVGRTIYDSHLASTMCHCKK